VQIKIVNKEMGLTRIPETFGRSVATIREYVKSTGTKTTGAVIGSKPSIPAEVEEELS
jgi:hypothetical protein